MLVPLAPIPVRKSQSWERHVSDSRVELRGQNSMETIPHRASGRLLGTEDPSCSTSVSPHVALLVDVIVFPRATGSLSSPQRRRT